MEIHIAMYEHSYKGARCGNRDLSLSKKRNTGICIDKIGSAW